jgi:23S rRNA (cytidine2498-2'-O)-methyltransferase
MICSWNKSWRSKRGVVEASSGSAAIGARVADHAIVYVAAEGREAELQAELGDAQPLGERLYAAPGPERVAIWAQNVWRAPREVAIESIGDAAKQLRAIQRNWVLHPLREVRRSRLIVDKLPPLRNKPRPFPFEVPTAPLGAFCLLDRDRMLLSAETRSPFPHGAIQFVEDKEGPPSRAYLKLWEALTILEEHPRPGERCLDLGSSPGGWTWALARLGADVISVDKAPLDPAVAAMKGVTHRQGSAFALGPEELGPVDWLFSDVIGYPERLAKLVRRWIEAGEARRIVWTVKLQGPSAPEQWAPFAAIEGGWLRHLFHNKHELTFFWRRDDAG